MSNLIQNTTVNAALKRSSMSVFTMSMLTVAAVLSLRNLPFQAEYGYSIIFYITLASLCFFVPSALVSAELASAFPQNGGVYLWVKEAFGPRWGFVAIFMQWVENLPWFPSVLTFIASSIAYVFNPAWATNRYFVFAVIISMLWLATWINFKGLRFSSFFSSSGALLGTIIPGGLIILMVMVYLGLGKPVQISFSWDSLIPEFDNINQLMLLCGMMVALSGMEMPAVYVSNMVKPSTQFPKAIFIACFLIILLSVFGALAIAFVIPLEQISFAAGADQAFDKIFEIFHIPWMTPIMCFLLAYGALTMVITWVLGPAKGLMEVAQEGYLPAYWQKKNKADIPVRILVLQAVISSLIATTVLFMPTVSGAFWIMSALASQLYMFMYMLMFAAVIKLRYSQPELPRPYKIPGGKVGIWLIGSVALLTALSAIVFGFIPTGNVREEGAAADWGYILFLGLGMMVFVSIPLICYHFYERKKKVIKGTRGKEEIF